MKTIRHLPKNEIGRDFFIGDLHGALDTLHFMMEVVQFDKSKDRVIACGDLVDRGDNSTGCLDLLNEEWFFSVFGNHEDFCIQGYSHYEAVSDLHKINGGQWFYNLSLEQRKHYVELIDSKMTHGILVETNKGLVGVVHADSPGDFIEWINSIEENKEDSSYFTNNTLWGRSRYKNKTNDIIKGVDYVVVGHQVVKEPLNLGNIFYIDTGAVFSKNEKPYKLTMMTIEDLIEKYLKLTVYIIGNLKYNKHIS